MGRSKPYYAIVSATGGLDRAVVGPGVAEVIPEEAEATLEELGVLKMLQRAFVAGYHARRRKNQVSLQFDGMMNILLEMGRLDEAHAIVIEKLAAVSERRYEEAARLRDVERKFYEGVLIDLAAHEAPQYTQPLHGESMLDRRIKD